MTVMIVCTYHRDRKEVCTINENINAAGLEVREDESLDNPALEVVNSETGEVEQVIDLNDPDVQQFVKLEPRTKDKETGVYSRPIPHISEVRANKEKLKEEKREMEAAYADKESLTIDDQMKFAASQMQAAFQPPRSRAERRAAVREAKMSGAGYTKRKRRQKKA